MHSPRNRGCSDTGLLLFLPILRWQEAPARNSVNLDPPQLLSLYLLAQSKTLSNLFFLIGKRGTVMFLTFASQGNSKYSKVIQTIQMSDIITNIIDKYALLQDKAKDGLAALRWRPPWEWLFALSHIRGSTTGPLTLLYVCTFLIFTSVSGPHPLSVQCKETKGLHETP